MSLANIDLRKILNLLEAHGGTEEDPDEGFRLAAALDQALASDPLTDAIDNLSSAVSLLHQIVSREHAANHGETLAELRTMREQSAADLRATRNQTTMLMVLAMSLNAALVGVGMSWTSQGVTVSGRGAYLAEVPAAEAADADVDADTDLDNETDLDAKEASWPDQ